MEMTQHLARKPLLIFRPRCALQQEEKLHDGGMSQGNSESLRKGLEITTHIQLIAALHVNELTAYVFA